MDGYKLLCMVVLVQKGQICDNTRCELDSDLSANCSVNYRFYDTDEG